MANEAKGAKSQSAEAAGQEASLLDQVIGQTRSRNDEQREESRRQISTLVEEVMQGLKISKDLETTINARIADIDQLLTKQLNEIVHQKEFQKLEASWRGLHYVVHESETSPMLKIRVLNASKEDLRRDLERAVEFDQSALFKKVYEEEYGTFGGAPYAALIGDYEFSRTSPDVALLEKISNVAAGAHAPVHGRRRPRSAELESFTDLTAPRDLSKIFESVDYAKWRSFRESEDSRYVGLCLPHILMRLPYGPRHEPGRGLPVRGGRRRARPRQVPVVQRGLCDGDPAHQLLRPARVVRGHPRSGGGRPGRGPAHPYLQDGRGRRGAEVPDRDRDHRPAGKGAVRPRVHPPRALQGHRLRGLLRRPVGTEAQEVRHRRSQCQRAALHTAAVHAGHVEVRPLSEVHDAGQDRELHVAARSASTS